MTFLYFSPRQKDTGFPPPPPPPSPLKRTTYLHNREKLVQEVSGSEEHLKAIVKVVVEQTEPLHHPVPIMAVDKFRLSTSLGVS